MTTTPVPGRPLEPGFKYGPKRHSGLPLLVKPPANPPLLFDLSHYQDKVNWAELMKENPAGIIAKCSDGLGSKDSLFETHRKNAHANGLVFGAYHFMRFGGLSAKDEAAFYLKCSGAHQEKELPLCLDVEWDKRNSKYDDEHMDDAAAKEALEILERIEEATKRTPIIYTSYPFFVGFKDPERFFRFHPWLPAYKVSGPKVPLPWSSWAFWQFTNNHPAGHRITGVNSKDNLDGNYFNGTMDQLIQLTK